VDVITLSRMNSKEIMKVGKKFPFVSPVSLRYNLEKWQKQNDSNINTTSNLIVLPFVQKKSYH